MTDILSKWIVDFQDKMYALYNNLKEIDNQDIFEKDDEVGIVFQEIKSLITDTKKIVVDDDDDEEATEDNTRQDKETHQKIVN
jgi:hypothetical protein